MRIGNSPVLPWNTTQNSNLYSYSNKKEFRLLRFLREMFERVYIWQATRKLVFYYSGGTVPRRVTPGLSVFRSLIEIMLLG